MNNLRRKLLAAAPLAALAGLAGAKPTTGKGSKTKRVFDPDGKPASKEIPLYSPVVSYGDTIFVSGHGVNTSSDVRKQTAEVLDYIEKISQSRRLVHGKGTEVQRFPTAPGGLCCHERGLPVIAAVAMAISPLFPAGVPPMNNVGVPRRSR